jgi:hypothetical protein
LGIVIWPATRNNSSLHLWLRRGVVSGAALCLLALGHLSKPISDQISSADFLNTWKPGTLPSSLSLPTIVILLKIAAIWLLLVGLDRFWLKPIMQHADMINAALEHLFVEWFGNTPGHRISFLAKRRLGFHLRVFFRYSHGTSTHFKSRAHFPRGVAVAGISWKYPSRFTAIEIPDFGHDVQAFRNYMRQTYRLSRWQARALSNETAEIRWIVCYGIVDPDGNFRGVLSIDSIDPASLVRIKPETLKACSDLLGAMMLAHDFSKPD